MYGGPTCLESIKIELRLSRYAFEKGQAHIFRFQGAQNQFLKSTTVHSCSGYFLGPPIGISTFLEERRKPISQCFSVDRILPQELYEILQSSTGNLSAPQTISIRLRYLLTLTEKMLDKKCRLPTRAAPAPTEHSTTISNMDVC